MELNNCVLIQEPIGLAYEGLHEFEAQHGCVEPIEIRSAVFCPVNQGVEKLVLFPIFVTENEFLKSLVQYQLSFHTFHKSQPKASAKQYSRKCCAQLSYLISPVVCPVVQCHHRCRM